MIGIYLSGTGNTKHCVEELVHLVDASAQCLPLEYPLIVRYLENQDTIVFGYPTQFSNLPFMVRDFIVKNSSIWKGKKVFCVNTLALFSGDGTGCAARILKKYGAQILGGLQIKMPDSVCDSKLLKKSIEENRQIVRNADQRIAQAAEQIRQGKYPQEGLSVGDRTAGMKDVATVYKINERYTMVLATKRYAYPNGSYIRKNAIIPDIHIPSNANDFNVFPDKQLMGAIDVR